MQKTRLGHLLSLSFFFFLSWALGSILLFILWPINCFGIKDLGFECSGSIRYTTIKTTSVPQDRRLFFFLTVYNKSSQRGSAHFCKAQIHLCPTAVFLGSRSHRLCPGMPHTLSLRPMPISDKWPLGSGKFRTVGDWKTKDIEVHMDSTGVTAQRVQIIIPSANKRIQLWELIASTSMPSLNYF